MAFLIREIIWFLLLTAVLWGAIGWLLRSAGDRSAARAIEQEYEVRMQNLARARDEYRDQLEQVAVTTPSGNLTTEQRSQIASHIGKLKQEATEAHEETVQLRAKLEALSTTARERDEEYRRLRARLEEITAALAERDRELEQLRAEKNPSPEQVETPSGEAAMAQLRDYKHSIARLNARIESLSRQQQEPMAVLEHTKLLEVIQAQKRTIAGMTKRLRAANSDKGETAPAAVPGQAAQMDRLQQQHHELTLANQQFRSHNEDLMEAMGEQETTIVTLKEQLRKSVQPAPRSARSSEPGLEQPSGDLFATPPQILMNSPDGEPDKLQKIHGVGPVLEAKLNELGIFHFRQIAALTQDDIGWIASKMKAFPNRIVRDRWVNQAAALADAEQATAPRDDS